MGIDPCGWCGRDGCTTDFIPSSASRPVAITSTCQYHYKEMNYIRAAAYSESSPCTNVTINCLICPPDFDGKLTTFWKYNFKVHMHTDHLNTNLLASPQCKMLPVQMFVSTFISQKEAQKIGIPQAAVSEEWIQESLPDSEALEGMIAG